MKKMLVAICLVTAFLGCTANERAKSFGGTVTMTVPQDKQFVNITWKDDHIWLLTTNRETNHKPTTYFFNEKSSYGMLNGEVIIKEQ